ncbi:MAG: LCP family protein [Candidatus Kerfeldbacteria bacterium]|nr:LCP family protein [Candidatus Kerfeldbacteria bacterium]
MENETKAPEQNFVERAEAQHEKHPNAKRGFLSMGKLALYLVVALFISVSTFSYRALSSANSILNDDSPLLTQVAQLVAPPEKMIHGEANDRVNVLLIGKGGSEWTAGELADSITIVSIQPSSGNVSMMSLPRDLYVDIPTLGWRKINNATAHGKFTDYPGGGEQLMREVVEDVTGLEIHYFASVDFRAFRDVVDDLGGIDVVVEKDLYDPYYPTYDFKYQTISFKAGEQHMNGERALQYARSRKTTSDFDRSRRQQIVLLAMKDTFFSVGTLVTPTRILDSIDSVGEHVSTNMKLWEMVRLGNLVKEIDRNNIVNTVVNNGPGGVLHAETTDDGAYILVPNAGFGNFSDIQYLAAHLFENANLAEERVTIEIQNGTKESGLGHDIAERLQERNFSIVTVGNAATQDHAVTTIYDLTFGKAPNSVDALEKEFGVKATSVVPEFLEKDVSELTYEGLGRILPQIHSNVDPASSDLPNIIIVVGADNSASVKAQAENTPSS